MLNFYHLISYQDKPSISYNRIFSIIRLIGDTVLAKMKAIFRFFNNLRTNPNPQFDSFVFKMSTFTIGLILTFVKMIQSYQKIKIASYIIQIGKRQAWMNQEVAFLINLIFYVAIYIHMEKRSSRIKYLSHFLIFVNICLLFSQSCLHWMTLLCLTCLMLTRQSQMSQIPEIIKQFQGQNKQQMNDKTSTIQINRKSQKVKLVNFKTSSGKSMKSQKEEIKERRKIKMVSIIQNLQKNGQKQKEHNLQSNQISNQKAQKLNLPSSHRRSHLVIKQIERITNPKQYYKRRKTEVILTKIQPQQKKQFDPYAWSEMHDLNSCGSSFSGTSSSIDIKHQKPYLMKSQNIPKKQFDAISRLQSQRLKSLVQIKSINQTSFVCQKLDTSLISKQYFDYENKPYLYITQKLRDVFIKLIPDQQTIFTIKLEAFEDFLRELGSLYNLVPYHNITHAFDVMTTMDKYLSDYGNILHKIQLVREEKIGRPNDLQIKMLRIVCLITAYAHDCGHQGFTSAFYLNTHDDLAINHLYESPLQQMHTSNLLALLRKYPVVMETICLPYRKHPEFNQIIFEKEIKHLMIKMILATDNAKHFQMIQRFKSCKEKIKYLFQEPQTKRFNPQKLKKEEQSMVFEMLLHSADLSNCTKDLQFLSLWTNHLYEEFKYQAAVQKQMGLPYSFAHIDFDNANLSQIGFINGFICPMISQICFIQPKFNAILQRALKNAEYYKKKEEQKTKRFAKSDNQLLAKIESAKSMKQQDKIQEKNK